MLPFLANTHLLENTLLLQQDERNVLRERWMGVACILVGAGFGLISGWWVVDLCFLFIFPALLLQHHFPLIMIVYCMSFSLRILLRVPRALPTQHH